MRVNVVFTTRRSAQPREAANFETRVLQRRKRYTLRRDRRLLRRVHSMCYDGPVIPSLSSRDLPPQMLRYVPSALGECSAKGVALEVENRINRYGVGMMS